MYVNKKIEYTYKIDVLVMTKIVFAHDQKHVHGDHFGRTKNLSKTHPRPTQ